MIDRQPCGCKHNGQEWTFMCEPCKTEHDATHTRWASEHREQENRREGAKKFKELF